MAASKLASSTCLQLRQLANRPSDGMEQIVSYVDNRRSDDYQCRPQGSQDHKGRKAAVIKGRPYRCESRVKGHGRSLEAWHGKCRAQA